MVLGQDVDVTTIDSTVWEVAKYFLVLFVGLMLWLGSELVKIIKDIQKSIGQMALDIQRMKDNSDNTQLQLQHISKEIDHLSTKIHDHEGRFLRIERQIKVS